MSTSFSSGYVWIWIRGKPLRALQATFELYPFTKERFKKYQAARVHLGSGAPGTPRVMG